MTAVHQRDQNKSALLIVDVQKGVVGAAYLRDETVSNINTLIEKARAKEIPVIWVQHSNDEMKVNSPEWEIVDELKPRASDVIIQKIYGDSFEATNLEQELEKLEVRKLIVVGAQTEACIRSTIHGAFTRGYDVTLVSDAHTTEDLTQYGLPSPEILIRFTNIYWGFQRAPDRKASVAKTAEVVF